MNEKQRLKDIFSRNLIHFMKINHKTQNDLCNDLGFTTSTISDWVTAKNYPRMDKVQMIADYFGIYKSDLTEDHHSANKAAYGVRIPVLGRVIAGIPIDAIEEIIDYEEISSKTASTGEYFALKIKGDSMEPQISEDDIVIIKKQNDIENNQIAIVLVNGHEATVKKVVKKENGIMLIPFNTEYEPIFYTCSEVEELPVQIIGRVVELRKKY